VHKSPSPVVVGAAADVTADFYHKYPKDIAIMKDLGLPHFRMSIAWPRIYPQGKGEVNLNGLAFYDKVIDGLLAANVKPYVTLYHWDLPLVRLLTQDFYLPALPTQYPPRLTPLYLKNRWAKTGCTAF
jgi:beta-glucosidase/6-phospho-beta-glucosidase/beta-galactosidase